ncbi:hypothetical protein D9Q98_002992 [Chlorella vulgaris]|uniref:Uncharacterized protein n=1 Tax=Chlorella vulgaris TaxID=3077 RepID=A0A9D4TUX4_CHLVU|nr:hypothetical protein D9Q98_002992 [Chlorella vulgaris]
MFGAILSALWSQDSPEQPRTPDSATSLDASIKAAAAARLAAARAQVAVMSAEERVPLAAAGRARFRVRAAPETFASPEAEEAYRHQRLVELTAALQEDIENNQLMSASTKNQAPHTPKAAATLAAEANADQRIPAPCGPACAQQVKLSAKEPEGPSAAAVQPYGKQVPKNADEAGQQAQRRAAEAASVDASRAPASEADGRDQQHRQQRHSVAVAAQAARRYYTVPAEKKNQ